MVCVIEIYEKPELKNPVLLEGLPGIGFVANIAALYLIRELKAQRFAEIHSSTFQDLAVTTGDGGARSSINELYYHKDMHGGRDLIIWYGNTQALTTAGQYELCGRALDIVEELGCRYVITLGGYRQEEARTPPQIYCTASDHQALADALGLGTKVMVGQVFGVAGLLVGLARLRKLKSFSLLVETLGTYPDAVATRYVLLAISKFLDMNIDLANLDSAAEETKKMLEAFGLIRSVGEEKKKEQHRFRWFV